MSLGIATKKSPATQTDPPNPLDLSSITQDFRIVKTLPGKRIKLQQPKENEGLKGYVPSSEGPDKPLEIIYINDAKYDFNIDPRLVIVKRELVEIAKRRGGLKCLPLQLSRAIFGLKTVLSY